METKSALTALSALGHESRLAAYRLQAGEFETAHRLCVRALQLVPEYAPAFLMQGRVLIAQGKSSVAAGPLQLAAARNPLPETSTTWASMSRPRPGPAMRSTT